MVVVVVWRGGMSRGGGVRGEPGPTVRVLESRVAQDRFEITRYAEQPIWWKSLDPVRQQHPSLEHHVRVSTVRDTLDLDPFLWFVSCCSCCCRLLLLLLLLLFLLLLLLSHVVVSCRCLMLFLLSSSSSHVLSRFFCCCYSSQCHWQPAAVAS